MPQNSGRLSAGELTIQMTPAVRHDAEMYAAKQGLSLNDFVVIAIINRIDRLKNEEWIRNRRPLTDAMRMQALAILDRAGSDEVEPGDELPEGYVSPFKRS